MFSLRTRFNEERIFNRIDSNDVFDNSTQNRCDLVEKYGVGFYREATYWPWKMITSKVSSMPPTSGWQVPRRAYESVLAADIVACSPSTAYVFLWRRTLGRYHSQLSRLGGESPKTPRTGQWRWRSYRSLQIFLCILGWSFGSRLSDQAGGKIVTVTAIIVFEEPPPGYAVVWSVSMSAAEPIDRLIGGRR